MRTRERGFTLVELMISMVLFSFIIAGVLAVAVGMVRAYREQRQVVAAESAARGPMNFLADAIRGASPSVRSGSIQDVATCTTNVFSTVNSTTGPDSLDVTFAYGAVVTSLRSTYTTGTTSITVTDSTRIFVGDTLLISNLTQGTLVTVTAVSSGTVTLVAQACSPTLPAGGYPAGSLVIRALRARFSIGAVDGIPTLMMDPDLGGPLAAEPLGEGVEDLQIALGVDVNGNGTIDAGEWAYASGVGALVGPIRAVRLTLVARASNGLDLDTGSQRRPAAEDHPIASTTDSYRRRSLTSIIEIRNLGASP